VRILVCLALLVSLPRGAYADDEDDAFVSNRRYSVAIGFAGHGSHVRGQSEGGFGALAEVAIGNGRWQYIGEGLVGSASLGDPDDALMHVGGRMLHGAAGVRWIARQFRPDSSAGVELFLMGLGGVERFYFDDGERVLRANAALGVGMQVRGYNKPHFALRIDGRIVFFRDDHMTTSSGAPGFMTGFAFAW
jgi:hypothetical protein